MQSQSRKPVSVFLLLSCAAAFAAFLIPVAATANAQTTKSPFLPPGFGEKAAPPPAASPLDSVEFRGVVTIDGKTIVTLVDSSINKSIVAEVGETVNNIKVSAYKVEGQDDVVTLASGSATRRVTLKKSKIVAMATPPPNATPLPAGQPQTGQQPGTVAQPQGSPANMPQMSDEEVRQRMQRVAEEIRRRRAVRRQMLEQNRSDTP